ncbi:MAG TPA: hypothetical protein VGE98_05735 [Thermoanaerobaculia bacterium]
MRRNSRRWSTGALGFVLALTPIAAGAPLRAAEGAQAMRPTEVPEAVSRLASRTLDDMRGAPRDLARTFGFLRAEDARQARLGSPLAEHLVPLTALRGYRDGAPVTSVVGGDATYLYPIFVGDAIRASIRLTAPAGAAPKVESTGGSEVFARLSRLPGAAERLRAKNGEALPALRIPALGLYFLTRGGADSLEIASLFDVPVYRLRGGSYTAAGPVFVRLAKAAKKLAPGAAGGPAK